MTWPCVLYEKIRIDAEERDGTISTWPVYRGPDGGEYTFKTLPIGAMFYDDCDYTECKRPDGRCLVVKVPSLSGRGFLWPIDHTVPGGNWTRTGESPHVTVSPSIHYVGEYHGWLHDGVLSDDLDGRSYG